MSEEGFIHKHKKSVFDNVGPKTSFWGGFGLALVLFFIIGFFILLGILLKQPEEEGLAKEAGKKEDTEVQENENKKQEADEKTQKNINDAPSGLSSLQVSSKDHIRGSSNAQISIIEFSDIQCPYCARFQETLNQVLVKYEGKVNWVYRHFPLESLHEEARPAAIAAECAGEQGKFWEYLDYLFANQSMLSSDFYTKAVENFSLDGEAFKTCLASGNYNNMIDEQILEAGVAGGSGTPHTVIIAGEKKIPVRGAVPLSQFESIIDSLLGGK